MPENAAQAKAEGKCCYCGVRVYVAEFQGRDSVLHEKPFCEKFLDPNDDPDAYARRCDLSPIDPIAEEFKRMKL